MSCIVYIDLETTGFGENCEVIQIGAVCGHLTFNAYIMPSCPIEPGAAAVNGCQVWNGQLFVWGNAVNTVPLSAAVQQFVNFLYRCGNRVVLVAHNAFGFDAGHLLKIIGVAGFKNHFSQICYGICDSLPLLQKWLPHYPRHNLGYLVDNLLPGQRFNLHDASEDCMALQSIMKAIGCSESIIVGSARQLSTFQY